MKITIDNESRALDYLSADSMSERPTTLFGDEKTLDNLTYWHDAWLHRSPD